jgi:hypothetical protein
MGLLERARTVIANYSLRAAIEISSAEQSELMPQLQLQIATFRFLIGLGSYVIFVLVENLTELWRYVFL